MSEMTPQEEAEVNRVRRRVIYRPPVIDTATGKRLSTANIIWAERNLGDCCYSHSKYAMKRGVFPADHPCAPFDDDPPKDSGQIGGSKRLTAFRSRGYWASCFPEGDGITFYWWEKGSTAPSEKTDEEVKRDIRECFGWEIDQ